MDVYILDALRTPIGRYGGKLSGVRPDDLFAHVLRALVRRHPEIDWNDLEEVICGAANQAGEDNRNVARMAVLLADLPIHVAGVTVNRLCASGLQAVIDAYRAIAVGEGDLIVAGGEESMSRAPFVLAKAVQAFDRNAELYDTTIGWRFVNPELAKKFYPFSMGETAENVAEKYGISREQQDLFAYRSQQRYKQAFEQGKFTDEIVPVEVKKGRGEESEIVTVDEHPRPDTTLEKLAQLKPVFRKNGTVTAGNSSGINDGAAALILASERYVKTHGLQPMARILGAAVAGVDPSIMGIGPVPATQKLLKRLGMKIDNFDLIELNEAFAAQAIACIQELGLDEERVNVNGGAIALGHPLGCSGARILTTLLHELKRRKGKYGLATLCVGVGQGVSLAVENLSQ
jgi:3-oxoadipyl-CoA thiolase